MSLFFAEVGHEYPFLKHQIKGVPLLNATMDDGEFAAVLLGADAEVVLATHHALFATIEDSVAAHYDRMAVLAALCFAAWVVG